MRLFSPSNTELAVDDDGGGGVEARIVHVPAEDGTYTIVVHSKSEGTEGVSTLYFDGTATQNFDFAGGHKKICSVATGHVVRTGHEPFGSNRHLAIFARGASTAASSGLLSGIVEQSLPYKHSETTTSDIFAIVSGPAGAPGPILVGRTDDGTPDADGDGLSEAFERLAGTCWDATVTIGTWDCGQYGIHPADTDRDGITDFEEFFGACDDTECLSVRRWGADPLHKDVYYQVDYYDTNFAFGDAWRDRVKARMGSEAGMGDASVLQNPDGLPGVRLHLDFARHDVGDPLEDADMPFLVFNNPDDDPVTGSKEVPDEPGVYKCSAKKDGDPNDVNENGTWGYHSMSPLRRQFYRWGRWQTGDGGTASVYPTTWPSRLCTSSVAHITAHEIGHNMGLRHGGYHNINGKANYRSLMNYLGQNHLPAFSSGVAHELDPRSMDESAGVALSGAQADYQPWMKDYVGFPINGGAVDWSRNRAFSGSTDLVRGRLVGWMSSSDSTKPSGHLSGQVTVAALNNEDKVEVSSSYTPCNTPAVVRYKYGSHDRAYVIWPICGNWNLREVHIDYSGSCPASYQYYGSCGGSTWSAPTNTGRLGTTVAAEVVTPVSGGTPSIYVATVHPTGGHIRILQAQPDSSGNLSSWSVTHTISGPVNNEPDIIFHNDSLRVMWRDGNDELWTTRMDLWTGDWDTPAKMLPSSGASALTSNASPRFGVNNQNGLLYFLRTNTSNNLVFHYLSGSYWPQSKSFTLPNPSGNDSRVRTWRKPGLAWVPDNFNNPTGPGSFLIAKMPGPSNIDELRAHPSNGFSFGRMRGTANNVGGVSLWFRPGSGDANPLMGAGSTNLGSAGGFRFFGYADAVVPFTFKDSDDQTKFAATICPSLRDSSGACDAGGGSGGGGSAGAGGESFEDDPEIALLEDEWAVATVEQLRPASVTCDAEEEISQGGVFIDLTDAAPPAEAACVQCEGL